ncbi:YhcN/YlaJ family sporulation lipoprotein [Shouchella clausii]|uniref:YhcN/YlaJ family sporulation lipoprotein n=2 Tax=Shouchella clausii TaxID=79880 RepID=UPI0032ED6203
MKKTALSFICASVLLTGLAGCGTQDNNRAGMQPNTYRNQEANLNGDNNFNNRNYPYYGPNAYNTNDKTFFDDNRFSNKNQRMNRTNNQYNQGRNGYVRGITGNNRPGMVDENGFLNRRADYGNRGMNFQRATTNKDGNRGINAQRSTNQDGNMRQGMETEEVRYHRNYDGDRVEEIREEVEKIDGVREARVIINRDDVVVGYEQDEKADDVKQHVENRVRKLAGKGKNVVVSTDNNIYKNMRKMDDKLRSGAAFDDVRDTFTDMMRDLGNAAKRPFQNK